MTDVMDDVPMSSPAAPTVSILLAHANVEQRETYRDYLRMEGYAVVEVSSTDDVPLHLGSCDLC